ncbi:hypothetical protein D3C71_197220 [compost metagenome]
MSNGIGELIDAELNEETAATEVADYLLHTEEDMMQHEYSWRIGEDDIDFDDEEVRADYEKFVHGRAQDRVEEAISELSWLSVEDGKIHIWRSITVKPDWVQRGITERPIGICWSHVESAAEAHFGSFSEGNREVTLHALVAIGDVNWQASVTLNAQCEEEREIRVREDALVEVLSATWSSEERGGAFVKEEIGLVLPAGRTALAPPEFA